MERLIAATLVPLMLAGCGVVSKVDARRDMQASKAAYKACLLAHPRPEDFQECGAAKAAYEIDADSYAAFSAGIRPGSVLTINDR